MWTEYQRHRQSHNSPGSSRVFLLMASSFLCSTPGFLCRRLSGENRFDPFIYVRRRITLIFFSFSGSRHPPFVFVGWE